MQVANARATDLNADQPTCDSHRQPKSHAEAVATAPDRIDRSLPQGDVYFSWAKGATWDAFFLRQDSGMAHGIGPKPPEQMAFAIKRGLQNAANSHGTPITFRATTANHAHRIWGRDANGSGIDISVTQSDVVLISTTQNGVRSGVLGMTERWHREIHDTGFLEKRDLARPCNTPWMPARAENAMTGKGDAS